MELSKNTETELDRPLAMHPKKFAFWLFLGTVVMLFAAFTSAYLVRVADRRDWYTFNIPLTFTLSTIAILLSSISMHWAYTQAKKDNLERVKWGLALTLGLGMVFLGLQIKGWWFDLFDAGVFFAGSSSHPHGSFFILFVFIHALHLISALIFLLVVLIKAFNYKVHSKNMLQLDMCTTYWHFLDLLWIYLFVFLLLNN